MWKGGVTVAGPPAIYVNDELIKCILFFRICLGSHENMCVWITTLMTWFSTPHLCLAHACCSSRASSNELNGYDVTEITK